MNIPDHVKKIRGKEAYVCAIETNVSIGRDFTKNPMQVPLGVGFCMGFDSGFTHGKREGVREVFEFLLSENLPICEAVALYAGKHFAELLGSEGEE